MKIKNIRKREKIKDSQKVKICHAFFCGVVVLSVYVNAIDTKYVHAPSAIVKAEMKHDADEYNSGFIKNGDEIIPYYYDYVLEEFYFYKNGKFIGNKEKSKLHQDAVVKVVDENGYLFHTSLKNQNIVDKNGSILYASPQIISYNDCYFYTDCKNVECDYEVIKNFDENVYKKYETEYVKDFHFPNTLINQYEAENVYTGEAITIFGYQISDTQYFNFETYAVEDYKNYNVHCIYKGEDIGQKYLTSEEILEFIRETRENHLTLN